jgi:hypothetical protein
MQDLYGKQIQTHNSLLIYMLGLFIASYLTKRYMFVAQEM